MYEEPLFLLGAGAGRYEPSTAFPLWDVAGWLEKAATSLIEFFGRASVGQEALLLAHGEHVAIEVFAAQQVGGAS
jgi:hypothetical protein